MSPQQLVGTLAPERAPGALRRFLVYLGPATLVSVGYMDPGNWASDLEAGARFGHSLLWVLVVANAIALLVQTLAARLGVVARLDLAQACRACYPRAVSNALFALCALAIIACDLAEVLGSAVAINLLFGLPLVWGALVTALDVFALLALRRLGVRRLEAIVVVLVLTVGACLAVESWLVEPATRSLAGMFSPRLDAASLYVAVAMLGATVMPHNLYLHSSLVQTRVMPTTDDAQRRALRYNFVDTLIALNVAFVINASILALAADVFHANGIVVTDLREAQRLLSPLLGTSLAGILFAVALLAAGQSSTITGTLAAQIVMQGFLGLRGSPVMVRMVTRGIAMLPAVLVLALLGDDSTVMLLVATQVVLSLQLPFALVPLIRFTSSRQVMGARASGAFVSAIAAVAALLVIACNVWLVVQTFGVQRGTAMWMLLAALLVGAFALLAYLAVAPLRIEDRTVDTMSKDPAPLKRR
ncbi:MAG TPA: Nramp family divalent metal transporter [Casimicrobiaceae bacterium]|jgi:manganese transport protein|nr:Nramp family divalent metal transporter [Casimicrobiaceae bacterium]